MIDQFPVITQLQSFLLSSLYIYSNHFTDWSEHRGRFGFIRLAANWKNIRYTFCIPKICTRWRGTVLSPAFSIVVPFARTRPINRNITHFYLDSLFFTLVQSNLASSTPFLSIVSIRSSSSSGWFEYFFLRSIRSWASTVLDTSRNHCSIVCIFCLFCLIFLIGNCHMRFFLPFHNSPWFSDCMTDRD